MHNQESSTQTITYRFDRTNPSIKTKNLKHKSTSPDQKFRSSNKNKIKYESEDDKTINHNNTKNGSSLHNDKIMKDITQSELLFMIPLGKKKNHCRTRKPKIITKKKSFFILKLNKM